MVNSANSVPGMGGERPESRVGAGRMQVKEVEKVLESGDRGRAGDTVPAKGLMLYKVHYPEEGKTESL